MLCWRRSKKSQLHIGFQGGETRYNDYNVNVFLRRFFSLYKFAWHLTALYHFGLSAYICHQDTSNKLVCAFKTTSKRVIGLEYYKKLTMKEWNFLIDVMQWQWHVFVTCFIRAGRLCAIKYRCIFCISGDADW